MFSASANDKSSLLQRFWAQVGMRHQNNKLKHHSLLTQVLFAKIMHLYPSKIYYKKVRQSQTPLALAANIYEALPKASSNRYNPIRGRVTRYIKKLYYKTPD